MKSALVVAIILIGCTTGPALITSRLYWGYWIVPPSAEAVTSSLSYVERFTTLSCCTPHRSGRAAVAEAAQTNFYGAGDWPFANLPAALVRRDLEPRSDDPVPTAMMTKIQEALESRGALVTGEPGYKHAKELWGHIATGRNGGGDAIVVAALWGGEVSNDHHAYYEAASWVCRPVRCSRWRYVNIGLISLVSRVSPIGWPLSGGLPLGPGWLPGTCFAGSGEQGSELPGALVLLSVSGARSHPYSAR